MTHKKKIPLEVRRELNLLGNRTLQAQKELKTRYDAFQENGQISDARRMEMECVAADAATVEFMRIEREMIDEALQDKLKARAAGV